MRIQHMAATPSAIVTVKVFPVGEPGKVLIIVESEGSAGLSDGEVGTLLQQAADSLRPEPGSPTS